MIKPASYWALHKTCDPYTLGRVAATLGGQTVDPPLSPAEKALVAVIQQDSDWMDERIDRERERQKERKRAYRERVEKEACPQLSPIVPETNGDKAGQGERNACPQMSPRQSETRGDKAPGTLVPDPPYLPPSVPPSVRPSVRPSPQKNLYIQVRVCVRRLRRLPRPRARACERIAGTCRRSPSSSTRRSPSWA